LSSLPENAFLPSNLLDSPERFGWMARRNSLFAQATAEEKKVLLDLAEWHGRQRLELVRKPNVFTEATAIRAQHWFYAEKLFRGPKDNPIPEPGVLVHALAMAARPIAWGEQRLTAWQRKRLLARLAQQVSVQQGGDAMLGVLYFFCSLRFDIASYSTEGLSKQFFALAEATLESSETPVKRLLARLVQLILLEDSVGHRHKVDTRFPALKVHAWRLLLRAVKAEPNWAYGFIDEHWRRESKWSGVLSVFALHGQFDLAHQLAITTRAERPEFAADMLLEAIRDAGWQATKDRSAPESLITLLDAACDHLWGWLQEPLSEGVANDDIRHRLDALFRYGNPVRPYWSDLPACALKVIESMAVEEQARVSPDGLLAKAIFYSEQGSPTAVRGMLQFRALLEHCSHGTGSVSQRLKAAVDATTAIEVLEGGILSGRNRFVAAQPEHALMQVVADHLDDTRERVGAIQPSTVLADLMQLTLGVKVETLFRRLMDQFRIDFTRRVESFPADAGLALQSLIRYKGYSQSDDDMYRKQVCQDLFDALVPLLEEVSATDAAVARSGIGWSPFPDDIW